VHGFIGGLGDARARHGIFVNFHASLRRGLVQQPAGHRDKESRASEYRAAQRGDRRVGLGVGRLRRRGSVRAEFFRHTDGGAAIFAGDGGLRAAVIAEIGAAGGTLEDLELRQGSASGGGYEMTKKLVVP